MSYDYDWCGHVSEAPHASPCGAPIERWSREWKHRKFELDADHKAVPQEPVGPLEEGLHLRADRYATALAASVAADERIAALTELLRQHEYYRSQAESALAAVQEDPQFGTVWAPTGPEPEDADALLCLVTGVVYYRRRGIGIRDGWRRAELAPDSAAVTYEWPISDAGPFIAWRDAYGFDQVLREAQRRGAESERLHRYLYGKDGYRPEGGGWARPDLNEAVDRILRAQMSRTYEATEVHGYTREKILGLVGGEGNALRHTTNTGPERIPADVALFEISMHTAQAMQREIPLVVANAPFDLTLLETELARHGIDTLASRPAGIRGVVDPMVIDKQWDPYRKGCYRAPGCRPDEGVHDCSGCRRGQFECGGCGVHDRKLESLCRHYGVPLVGAHDAAADALAAARLAVRLGGLWRQITRWKLETLHAHQVDWKVQQADSLRDFWKRKGDERWAEVDGAWPVRPAPVVAGGA